MFKRNFDFIFIFHTAEWPSIKSTNIQGVDQNTNWLSLRFRPIQLFDQDDSFFNATNSNIFGDRLFTEIIESVNSSKQIREIETKEDGTKFKFDLKDYKVRQYPKVLLRYIRPHFP